MCNCAFMCLKFQLKFEIRSSIVHWHMQLYISYTSILISISKHQLCILTSVPLISPKNEYKLAIRAFVCSWLNNVICGNVLEKNIRMQLLLGLLEISAFKAYWCGIIHTVSIEFVFQLTPHCSSATSISARCFHISTTRSTHLTHEHTWTNIEPSIDNTSTVHSLQATSSPTVSFRRSDTYGAKQFYSVARELFYCAYRVEYSLVKVFSFGLCGLFVICSSTFLLLLLLSFDYSTSKFGAETTANQLAHRER